MSAIPSLLRLLVIDGEARTSHRLAHMLREDGYEVDVATEEAEAIARLERVPSLHAIMTDFPLTWVSGDELVRLVRRHHPVLPVIVVTSHPNLAMRFERDLDPPARVLTKPIVYDELRALLVSIDETRLAVEREIDGP